MDFERQVAQTKQDYARELYHKLLEGFHPQKLFTEKEIGMLEELAELNDINVHEIESRYTLIANHVNEPL